MKKALLLLLIALSPKLQAKEGMWIPMLLNQNIEEMQAMGLQLTAEDIYSINNSSLKDAIVSFGGFCTGELISSQGLVLTNHHCGFGQIQQHSSVEHDYLKNGFWANNKGEELTNPGLFVEFLVYMEEVTAAVVAGGENRDSTIKAIIAQKESEDGSLKYKIRGFFYDNQYYLLASKQYHDVRLVGAPPSSIGKFGADTDNWVWPRHTGDFSLFRVYADGQNNPAQISPDNVPFKPAQHLKINIGPKNQGDFTFVFGYPGRTEEYLPAVGVDQMINVRNPEKIAVRTELLGIYDKHMRADDATRIQYASKYARVANGWKKWIGQVEGIAFSRGVQRKKDNEAAFLKATSKKKYAHYAGIIPAFDSLYAALEPHALKRDMFIETMYYGMEWMALLSRLERMPNDEARSAAAKAFMKDFSPVVSEEATAAMLVTATKYLPESKDWYADYESAAAFSAAMHKSFVAGMESLVAGDSAAYTALKATEAGKFSEVAWTFFRKELNPAYGELQNKIAANQKAYMAALMDVYNKKQFYPDANGTLRITYGQIDGLNPRDAVTYHTHTYLEGVMAKYKPGDYEFDVPEQLINLYNEKDYGPYAENGKLPVCFIASNHTTGGNSGSPALNARGELIGLNFDRIWEGTMSDVNFDERLCRNIMVDSRYVLFIIEKFAGQKWLIDEMDIVTE